MVEKEETKYTWWEKFGYALLTGGILTLLFMIQIRDIIPNLVGLSKTTAVIFAGLFSSISMTAGLLLIRGGWKESSVRAKFITAGEQIERWKKRRESRKQRRIARRELRRQRRAQKRSARTHRKRYKRTISSTGDTPVN